ncbi:hypothetical protein [Embleya scabrispora]|uniref:hypothetical protein n=1 Tax=Embleya scabrispora TaxID=159449 RepID=UPI001F3E7DCB|nr:hypothetical protein [Embleya scabrispora]
MDMVGEQIRCAIKIAEETEPGGVGTGSGSQREERTDLDQTAEDIAQAIRRGKHHLSTDHGSALTVIVDGRGSGRAEARSPGRDDSDGHGNKAIGEIPRRGEAIRTSDTVR